MLHLSSFILGFCMGVLVLAALAQLYLGQFVTVKDVLALSPSFAVLIFICVNVVVLDVLLLFPRLLAFLSPPVRSTVHILLKLFGLAFRISACATTATIRLLLVVAAAAIQGRWEIFSGLTGRAVLAAVHAGYLMACSTGRVVCSAASTIVCYALALAHCAVLAVRLAATVTSTLVLAIRAFSSRLIWRLWTACVIFDLHLARSVRFLVLAPFAVIRGLGQLVTLLLTSLAYATSNRVRTTAKKGNYRDAPSIPFKMALAVFRFPKSLKFRVEAPKQPVKAEKIVEASSSTASGNNDDLGRGRLEKSASAPAPLPDKMDDFGRGGLESSMWATKFEDQVQSPRKPTTVKHNPARRVYHGRTPLRPVQVPVGRGPFDTRTPRYAAPPALAPAGSARGRPIIGDAGKRTIASALGVRHPAFGPRIINGKQM